MPEFAETLGAVVSAHGPAWAIIAHSMGATATAVALSDGMRTGRLALLAPMASPESYARYFARALGFGDRIFRRLVARIERRVGAPLRHFDAPRLGRAIGPRHRHATAAPRSRGALVGYPPEQPRHRRAEVT